MVVKYIVLGAASIIGYGAVRIAFGEAINDIWVETVVFGVLFSLFFALYEWWARRNAQKVELLEDYEKSFVVGAQGKTGKLFLCQEDFTFKGTRGRYKKTPLKLSYKEVERIDLIEKGWNYQLILELKSGRIRFNFSTPEEVRECNTFLKAKIALR